MKVVRGLSNLLPLSVGHTENSWYIDSHVELAWYANLFCSLPPLVNPCSIQMQSPAEELAILGGGKIQSGRSQSNKGCSPITTLNKLMDYKDQYNTSHLKSENSSWHKGVGCLILFTLMKILPVISSHMLEAPKCETVTLTFPSPFSSL